MEDYEQRRRQAHENPPRNDRARPGYDGDDRDRGQRNFGDERQGEQSESRDRDRDHDRDRGGDRDREPGEARESRRGQQRPDDRPSSFSPDWSQDAAEPRYSGDRYYSRNRDYQQPRSDERSRRGPSGRWRGDQDRRTTEEQRARGFEPRGAERDDWFGDSGRGLYGSDSLQDYQNPDFDRGRDDRVRDDEQQSYYRGYYDRSVTPYESPDGRANLYVESWTIAGPHTGRGPKGYTRSHQQIVEEASLRLERSGQVDATDIEVTAENGVIRLRGTVPDRASKRRAEECVETVYGAYDVMNELRVAAAGARAAQQSTQSASGSERSSGSSPSSAAPERSSGDSPPPAQSAEEEKSPKSRSGKPRH